MKMVSNMVEVQFSMTVENYTKVNLEMIAKRAMGAKYTQIIQYIRDSSRMDRKMVKGGSNGQMVRYMMVNGRTI